jgi:hypothetical protein
MPITEKNEMDIGFKKLNREAVVLLWKIRTNTLLTLRQL